MYKASGFFSENQAPEDWKNLTPGSLQDFLADKIWSFQNYRFFHYLYLSVPAHLRNIRQSLRQQFRKDFGISDIQIQHMLQFHKMIYSHSLSEGPEIGPFALFPFWKTINLWDVISKISFGCDFQHQVFLLTFFAANHLDDGRGESTSRLLASRQVVCFWNGGTGVLNGWLGVLTLLKQTNFSWTFMVWWSCLVNEEIFLDYKCLPLQLMTSLDGPRDWLRDGDASRIWSWNAWSMVIYNLKSYRRIETRFSLEHGILLIFELRTCNTYTPVN